jgi:hypothetical protein
MAPRAVHRLANAGCLIQLSNVTSSLAFISEQGKNPGSGLVDCVMAGRKLVDE